ncbi:hypothetical protein BDR03DRAFT_819369, partial [Suillus americanus]
RPSDYLRSRCPICFGLDDWRKIYDRPDIHTCIDTCFTEKCSSDQCGGGPDPPNPVRLVFLSDDEVTSMEVHVQSCRDKPLDQGRKRKLTSVLDGCSDSVLAADEKHEKASTKFFADTGVMAMLC